jgi:hypothetical protein
MLDVGLRLCVGKRPVAGELVLEAAGQLGKAVALPRLDTAADLGELFVGDGLLAPRALLAADMQMRDPGGTHERGGRANHRIELRSGIN